MEAMLEQEISVPQGWKATTLGQLGRYLNGRGFKRSEWSDKGLPIIRIQNLTGSGEEFNYYDGKVEDRHVVNTGDLLVSWAATLDAFIWDGPKAALNQHIFKVESFIDKKFHYYLIKVVLDELYNKTHGSGMVHVTRGVFDNTPVAIPGEKEQRRIVEAIERQLGRLEAGVARLHAAKARLKRYKQSVLKAAVEGAGSDTEEELCTLAELVTSGSRGWAEYYADSGDTFIRAQNLKYDTLNLEDIAYVRLPEKVDGLRTQVQKNDILITITGANVTKTALVTEEPEGRAFVNQHIALVRLKDPSQAPFVFRWIISPAHGRGILEKLAYGAGKPGLNLSNIRDLRIPLPSPKDQVKAVAKLEAIDAANDELEATLDAQLLQAGRLRQAVLKRAFEGRLV
jgi:type I restriction enzyme S subunit